MDTLPTHLSFCFPSSPALLSTSRVPLFDASLRCFRFFRSTTGGFRVTRLFSAMRSTRSIAEAIRSIPEKKESLRKAYEELRSLSSSLSSFTLQWSDLEDHLRSIQASIDLRFKDLESKEKSWASSSGVATLTTVSDLKSEAQEAVPRAKLKEICASMDGKALHSFVNDNRKDLTNLKNEIAPALRLAEDPSRLVLDAMEGFYSTTNNGKGGSGNKDSEFHTNKRTCILLLERLSAIKPDIFEDVRENAMKIAVEWKGKIVDVTENSMEAWAFLQLLAAYRLTKEFNADEIVDIIVPISRRKSTIDVCKEMDMDDKIPDLIEKLNRKGKYLDAVKFAHAFDLMEKFRPVPLLKEYLKESKNAAQEVRNKGNNSAKARNEATAKELSAYKAVVKAIEEYNLVSEYPPENLKKQITRLEQTKAEKKRTATSSFPTSKNQQVHLQKRARPDTSLVAASAAAYPLGTLTQSQPQLGLSERASYLSSIGQYGLAVTGSMYDHGASSLLGPPVSSRSPAKSYLYSSEPQTHLGSLYSRPPTYDGRQVAYDTRASAYDSRQVIYESRPVAYDNVGATAVYDNRAAAYASYNPSSGLPPQYNNSQQQ